MDNVAPPRDGRIKNEAKRRKALAMGFPQYLSRIPCARCGSKWRYSASATCIYCHKRNSYFRKHPRKPSRVRRIQWDYRSLVEASLKAHLQLLEGERERAFRELMHSVEHILRMLVKKRTAYDPHLEAKKRLKLDEWERWDTKVKEVREMLGLLKCHDAPLFRTFPTKGIREETVRQAIAKWR